MIKMFFKKFFSLIGSFLLFLFGDFDLLLKTILALMFLDYVTGICKSFIKHKINSSIGAEGIIKKVTYLCCIAVSVMLDLMLNVDGGLRTLIITTFIFNEITAINKLYYIPQAPSTEPGKDFFSEQKRGQPSG